MEPEQQRKVRNVVHSNWHCEVMNGMKVAPVEAQIQEPYLWFQTVERDGDPTRSVRISFVKEW
jgi:hypothetical protein